MIKSDDHMRKVKGRLVKQQEKIQKFEDKKHRMENKKFHKAIKNFTQEKRHQEKRQNMEAISELKEKIKSKSGDVDDKEFNKIMMNKGSQRGVDPRRGQKTQKKDTVLDQVRYAKAKKGEAGRVGKGRFN